MAYGYTLEATYEDGYVHSELELKDISAYIDKKNVFHDIINKLPETEHGKIIKFSAIREVPQENGRHLRYDIDFSDFPGNAKPIYYRRMERIFNSGGVPLEEPRATDHFFGYEFHDHDGKKVKEEMRLP